jgi:hypothetical protein
MVNSLRNNALRVNSNALVSTKNFQERINDLVLDIKKSVDSSVESARKRDKYLIEQINIEKQKADNLKLKMAEVEREFNNPGAYVKGSNNIQNQIAAIKDANRLILIELKSSINDCVKKTDPWITELNKIRLTITNVEEEYRKKKTLDILYNRAMSLLNLLKNELFTLSVDGCVFDFSKYVKNIEKLQNEKQKLVFYIIESIHDGGLLNFFQQANFHSQSFVLKDGNKLTTEQLEQILQCLVIVGLFAGEYDNTDENTNFLLIFNTLVQGVKSKDEKMSKLTPILIKNDDISSVFTLSKEQEQVKQFVNDMLKLELIGSKSIRHAYFSGESKYYSDIDNNTQIQSIINAIFTLLSSALHDEVDKILHKFIGPSQTIETSNQRTNLMYDIVLSYIKQSQFTGFSTNISEHEALSKLVDFCYYVSKHRPLKLSYSTSVLQSITFNVPLKQTVSYRANEHNGTLYHVIRNYLYSNNNTSSGSTSFSMVDAKGTFQNGSKSIYEFAGECASKVIILYLLSIDLQGVEQTKSMNASDILKCVDANSATGGKQKRTIRTNKPASIKKKTAAKRNKATSVAKTSNQRKKST